MTSYDDFIRRIAGRSDLAGFLMTPDSAFGHQRRGSPAAVAELGVELGYDVVVIPSLDLEGRPVRSAEIRSDIASGDLAGAARLLGRPYAVVGVPSLLDDGLVRLEFPMPVALPPAGEYRASVGPDDDSRGGDRDLPVAVLAEGAVEVAGWPSGDHDPDALRVTFG